MIKKVIIAGIFLGGGIFFIKKILPLISSNSNNKDSDLVLKNLDDTWEEQDRLRREREERIRKDIIDKFGSLNPSTNDLISAVDLSNEKFENLGFCKKYGWCGNDSLFLKYNKPTMS